MSYSGDIYAFSLVRKHPHLETKVTTLGNKVTQSLFSTSLGLCWTLTMPRCVKAALAYLEPLMRSRDLSGEQRVELEKGPPEDSEVSLITEQAPTRAFSWLKAPTSTFSFKTLCYAKRVLTHGN